MRARPEHESTGDQRRERDALRHGHDVLHRRAGRHAEVVHHRERDDRERRDPERSAERREHRGRDEPLHVSREPHRHRRDRSRRDRGQDHPPIKEGDPFSERLPKVHIRAAGIGHHRAELRVRERARERHHAAQRPHSEHELRARQRLRRHARREEDPAPDDAADHQHRGGEHAELPPQRGAGGTAHAMIRSRWISRGVIVSRPSASRKAFTSLRIPISPEI